MSIKTSVFGILAAILIMMSSCLKGNEQEYTSYTQTAIISFKLGNLKMRVDTIGRSGKDTTYYRQVNCSKYVFSIDHVNKLIYNQDSLPKGIDAQKIICDVTAAYGGVLFIKNKDKDSTAYYIKTDSIDFSTPRTFRVVNSAGTAVRDYKVTINIHKESPNACKWVAMTTDNSLKSLKKYKTVVCGTKLWVAGTDGQKTLLYVNNKDKIGKWLAVKPTGVDPDQDAYQGVVSDDNNLYLVSRGKIYVTTDGGKWTVLKDLGAVKAQIMAVSKQRIYLVDGNGKFWEMSKNGGQLTPSTIEESNAALLPKAPYSTALVSPNATDDISLIVTLGNAASSDHDGNYRFWCKTDEQGDYTQKHPWTYITPAQNVKNKLPEMAQTQIASCGKHIVAMGLRQGTNTLSPLYFSKDGGVRWYTHPNFGMPTDLSGNHASFALTADREGMVWIVDATKDKIYCARLAQIR